MSTITKQWLQQTIADMEASRDEIPFGLDEDDSNTLAGMKLALASLEAEPVEWRVTFILDGQPGSDFETTFESQAKMNEIISLHERAGFSARITPLFTAPPANAEPVAWLWSHRKHPSEVTLVRPEDDERAEGAHWSGWSCQALYEAQPAPVSVPDDVSGPLAHAYKELTPTFMRNHIDIFERYGIYPDGSAGIQAVRIALDGMSRRAAMLQGAEPVTTACKLPELTDSQCLEFLAVAFRHASIKGDIEFDDIRLGLKMALEAAPKQEVKP
ncbi:hypothetical protein L8O47_02445 [Enterobacter roggenkampii]|uniref:hypothetical protein n=1 Tax=Enterobacter roggenkampii TaxID=1812935 RepID=UPI002002CD7B|nr:hypothetical protein [Enterobacter roggenkampii]MCK7149782.1 hypothetical protein [Enterobacter roggenkampii]